MLEECKMLPGRILDCHNVLRLEIIILPGRILDSTMFWCPKIADFNSPISQVGYFYFHEQKKAYISILWDAICVIQPDLFSNYTYWNSIQHGIPPLLLITFTHFQIEYLLGLSILWDNNETETLLLHYCRLCNILDGEGGI